MSKTIKEKYDAIQKIGSDVAIPWNVARLTHPRGSLSIYGSLIGIGSDDADYGSLEEVRTAIEWYAEQLGGKVKWQK